MHVGAVVCEQGAATARQDMSGVCGVHVIGWLCRQQLAISVQACMHVDSRLCVLLVGWLVALLLLCRYKQLLLKQRDIMIALTARLNERDEQIMTLQVCGLWLLLLATHCSAYRRCWPCVALFCLLLHEWQACIP